MAPGDDVVAADSMRLAFGASFSCTAVTPLVDRLNGCTGLRPVSYKEKHFSLYPFSSLLVETVLLDRFSSISLLQRNRRRYTPDTPLPHALWVVKDVNSPLTTRVQLAMPTDIVCSTFGFIWEGAVSVDGKKKLEIVAKLYHRENETSCGLLFEAAGAEADVVQYLQSVAGDVAPLGTLLTHRRVIM